MADKRIELILFLAISLLFVFIEEHFAILMWLSFYVIGDYISQKLNNSIKSRNYFVELYYIFSFIGLIICIDNYYNFGELTGFAGDDTRFFNGVTDIIGQDVFLEYEINPFSYFIAVIAYPISIFKEVSVADVIVVNWAIAALIGVQINKLCNLLLEQDIPLFLLIIVYPLQFIMTDSLTRLYRDNLLLLFLAISVIGVFQSKKLKVGLSLIPIGILRLANLSFVGILVALRGIKIKKLKYIIGVVGVSSIILVTYLPKVVHFAVMYGSDISRVDRFEDVYSGIDSERVLELRYANAQKSANPLRAYAYSNFTVDAIAIRAMFSYFYPLSFENPGGIMQHSRKGSIEGFYFYKIINWVNTLSLVFVAPLLFIGIVSARNRDLIILIGTCLLFLLLVLLISGQGRHSMGAYIFNSIIATNALYFIKTIKYYKYLYILLSLLMFIVLVLYNL